MNQALTAAALAALLLASCGEGKEIPAPPAPPAPPKAQKPAEPDIVTVKHILVKVGMRKREDAEQKAYEVLGRIRKGEDFDKVMKEVSEDPGPGTYTLVNDGVQAPQGAYPRKGMVSAFGDVGFRLNVGELGFAVYDEKASPHGYHIILRVK